MDTANQTADNLFSDVLGRKDRADSTRNALSVLTRFRFIFFLTESIDENLKQVNLLTFHITPKIIKLKLQIRIKKSLKIS